MYREYLVIDGVLCQRGSPTASFKEMSAREITSRLVEIEKDRDRLLSEALERGFDGEQGEWAS